MSSIRLNRRAVTLAERARRNGYAPPPRKFGSFVDYREGEGGSEYIDYANLLLDPEETALVIVDMQNIFTAPGAAISSAGGAAIVPNVNRLVATFRALELPIVWVAWSPRSDGSNMGRFMPDYWGRALPPAEDDESLQIYPELDFRPDDVLVKKTKYNAFWGTDLEAILRTAAASSVVFAGIATDVCVGTTLIDAFHRDFNCTIVSDGTATTTPHHESTLWTYEKYWSRVLTTDEVIAELQALVAVPAVV